MAVVYVTSILTVAVVCVGATIVASMALKNRFIKRLNRQLRYWQERALADEQLLRQHQRNS